MKFLLLSLLILNALATNWQGAWTISNSSCDPKSCCCLLNGTLVSVSSDPNNNSQVLVTGQWAQSNICNSLGWKSNSPVSFPWAVNDISALEKDKKYTGSHAVGFDVTIHEIDEYLLANITMNQQSAGGSGFCPVLMANTPTWQGDWYVLESCDTSTCCCPDSKRFSVTTDPSNNSQILINSPWQSGNKVCNNLGWTTNKTTAWPWSANYLFNNYSPVGYLGAKGIQYTVANVYIDNNTLLSEIRMDQSSVGGSKNCYMKINNAPPKWNNEWLSLKSCNANSCCCPSLGAGVNLTPDPTNSSQFLMTTSWQNNSICRNLGWSSQNPVAFPLSPNDLQLDGHAYQYQGAKGIAYSVTTKGLSNTTYFADITMDQSKVGGSSSCNLEMNNNPPAWKGDWMSLFRCGSLDCCCLIAGQQFAIDYDPTNSSQLLLHGVTMTNAPACKRMQWSNNSVIIWPWGNYDMALDGKPHTYADSNGVKYSWAMTSLDNSTLEGTLTMDQTSVGGANYCMIPINNHWVDG